MNKLHLYLSNLDHNYKIIRSQLSSNTDLFAVVKAGAYGSGLLKIAKRLEQLGVDYLAVAYAKEGKVLREGGINISDGAELRRVQDLRKDMSEPRNVLTLSMGRMYVKELTEDGE